MQFLCNNTSVGVNATLPGVYTNDLRTPNAHATTRRTVVTDFETPEMVIRSPKVAYSSRPAECNAGMLDPEDGACFSIIAGFNARVSNGLMPIVSVSVT